MTSCSGATAPTALPPHRFEARGGAGPRAALDARRRATRVNGSTAVLSRRSRVPTTMRHVTRRQAVKLGAAAAALGALRPGSVAAAPRAGSFSLDPPSPAGAAAAGAGWHTTRVYRAPRRFDLIGLGWTRGSRAQAQVRARPLGGAWSPWLPLHAAGDHGPDAGRGPAGTDPAWTGAADEFQLRLIGHPRGLRARFVRSGPAARAARSRIPLARAAARRRQVPGAPPIIPRSAWGG